MTSHDKGVNLWVDALSFPGLSILRSSNLNGNFFPNNYLFRATLLL